MRMENPRASHEIDEMRQAEATVERMRNEDAWAAALPGGSGYREARSSQVGEGGHGG